MREIEKFPYKSVIPGAPLLPIIEVEIDNVGVVLCILDSGATMSTFPMKIGKLAGVDFEEAQESTSECAHGDKTKSYIAPMRIKIRGEAFTILVNFLADGGDPALLGRKGFFDRFEITFDEQQREVRLKRNVST